MRETTRTYAAEELMREFVSRTGILESGVPGTRYLWTDAFAVFVLLGLYELTGKGEYLDWTVRLVDQVHHVLGRHRPDDPRSGWISGLGESEGLAHPTRGGLRIGKRLNERRPGDPFDERHEWERDGQYFHYLTKWMHALNRVTLVTGDGTFNAWALELADAAHRAFVNDAGTRLAWKMSIDLSRPLVASTGQLDALDGLVACARLEATCAADPRVDLGPARSDLERMCAGARWVTADELGIGGLLTEVGQLVELIATGELDHGRILDRAVQDAEHSVGLFAAHHRLDASAPTRLAFRELGLAIGLQSARPARALVESHAERFRTADALLAQLDVILRHAPLTERIERFWLDPANQATAAWAGHRDINSVMLATSLVPEICLAVQPTAKGEC